MPVYTMYHGTTVASARLIITNGFRQSSGGMLGRGVYVSRDEKKALRYPLQDDGKPYSGSKSDQVVLMLHVDTGSVKRIDQKNHPMQKSWHKHGYDTAWVPPNCGMVPSGLEEDCVFDPKRVEVIGIVQAHNDAIETELEALIANNPKRR